MRLLKKTSQYRRDFTAIYECDWEDCGHQQEGYGYDDFNFHQFVIPTRIQCQKCGRYANPATVQSGPSVPEGVDL